jgi:hypothetical protein
MKLLDRVLIAQTSRDLFARSLNLTEIKNYLCIGNPEDLVHGWWTTAGSHGPPWTDGSADRRVPGTVGPPATPGHMSSLAGAGNVAWSMTVWFRASPGLRRQCGGRAMVMKQRWRRSTAAVALKLQERWKREGVGAVRIGGGLPLL